MMVRHLMEKVPPHGFVKVRILLDSFWGFAGGFGFFLLYCLVSKALRLAGRALSELNNKRDTSFFFSS